MQSIGGLLRTDAALSVRRFENNQVLTRQVPGYVPPFLGHLFDAGAPPVYLSSDTIRQQGGARRNARMLLHVCAVTLYLAAGFAAAFAALILETRASVRFGRAVVVVCRYAAVVLVLAALGISLHDNVFGYKCATLVATSLGICAGVHWGAFHERRAGPARTIASACRRSRPSLLSVRAARERVHPRKVVPNLK